VSDNSVFKKSKSRFQRKNEGIKPLMSVDGPAIVRVNLFVRSITTISDIKMVSGGHPVLVDSLEVLHICYDRPLWGSCCYSS